MSPFLPWDKDADQYQEILYGGKVTPPKNDFNELLKKERNDLQPPN